MTAELDEAERSGKHSRAYIEAAHVLRHYEWRLERAQEKEAERARYDNRPAKEVAREVVDRLMDR